MKACDYTIKDTLFQEILESFSEELEREGIQYALVGGAATQARIANLLTKNGVMAINDAPGLEYLIRKTGDFDVAMDISEHNLVAFFNNYSAINAGRFSINQITNDNKSLRIAKGSRYMNLNLEACPEDFKGLPNSYYDIINTSEPVGLRRGNSNIIVNVAKPEYIVASKLTRLEEKDKLDVYNLINCMYQNKKKFNFEEVKNVLKENNKEKYLDYLKEVHFEIVK